MSKYRWLLLLLLSSCNLLAQGSGNVLSFNGTNQYVNIGSTVSDNCRTIEMWFKPASNIGPNLPDVKTLVARDYLSGSGQNIDEFGIYFSPAPWNAAVAGKMVFYRRVGTVGYWVYSNSNAWQANVWYHVAGVIDPVNGMQMYVNGVLQSSTDPSTQAIQIQTGSPTDDIMLATWGDWGASAGQRFFDGDIDEVRFWTTARTQTEVRETMCRKVNPSQAGLQGYYRFDSNNTSVLNDLTGNGYNGTLMSIANNAWHYSSAPIGDTSTYVYTGNWSAQTVSLQFAPGDEFDVSGVTASPDGVHIYRVASLPNSTTGLTAAQPEYYGVFLTGTSGTYTIDYDFSLFTTYCQNGCKQLSCRNDNAVMNWIPLAPTFNNCTLNKTNESSNGVSYREEYILNTNGVIPANVLGSDTVNCSGQLLTLSVANAGDILWSTGDTTSFITVVPGTYWVTITTNGCTTYDTINIGGGNVPAFTLGSDTTLCPGENITLTAPVSAATYLWSDGSNDATLDVTAPGIYSVMITDGACSRSDTVQVAYEIAPGLGNDLSFCTMPASVLLDASLASAPYLWSTGDTTASISINEPGMYWVLCNAQCLLSDTILIDGEIGGGTVYTPNSFTPNGDGKNDVFLAYGISPGDFHMEIFDRWGEFIFESYDISAGWNGTYRNERAQEEVYVVRIHYFNSCEAREVTEYRHVTLLR